MPVKCWAVLAAAYGCPRRLNSEPPALPPAHPSQNDSGDVSGLEQFFKSRVYAGRLCALMTRRRQIRLSMGVLIDLSHEALPK